MAKKGERIEISVAVLLGEDCPDIEVMDKARYAVLDAQTQLLGIPGARRFTSGFEIGPLKRYHRKMYRRAESVVRGAKCSVCGEYPHRGDCPTLPPNFNYGMPR